MVRVFVEPFGGELAEVTGEQHHYLTRVMRLGAGDGLLLLDGSGQAYECRVESADKAKLVARVVASSAVPEPPVAVTLYQALPKADKLDWILQKATELGVARIVPLVAARSVAQVKGEKVEGKLARWRKLVTEAAEQSERGRVPLVEAPLAPGAVVLGPGEWGYVLAERGERPSLTAALPPAPPAGLALFVGPEGGWTPQELEVLGAAGAKPVSLGPRILRTETAALAALALTLGKYEL